MTAARSARRGLLVAVVSTVAVAALVVTAIGSSAAWPIVQQAFFSARYFGEAFPRVLGAFLVNVQLLCLPKF